MDTRVPQVDVERSAFAFTTRRPIAVAMMVIAAVVFGWVGLRRLPVTLLPDISYPTVTVRTEYPGSSPVDVEERVSERVQEAVSVVPGVRRVVSISRAGVSDVILEFTWGTEMVFAVSDIRERLQRVVLPREVEQPLVLRYDPSLDPVLTYGVFGDVGAIELRRIAEDELERELGKVDGVAAVKLRGGDEEEIRIVVDEQALTVLGLEIATIARRLAAENVNAASGTIEEGDTEFLVRTVGEFRNLEEIRQVIVERRNDAAIRLRDVARVVRVPQDRDVISRVDGVPCVLVDVYKEAGANVVQLARKVRERVAGTAEQQAYVETLDTELTLPPPPQQEPATTPEERAARRAEEARRRARHRRLTDYLRARITPFDADVTLLQDQSRFIESSIDDVLTAAIQGGLFAVLVILAFLRRITATLILAVSIPVSLVAAFAPMFLSGVTLNIMSLGGLALGVGMLVDNSIVVLESITRAREQGRSRRDAAVAGVSRVASAVTASTLTTVAVFFPIVFVEGVAGQLFRDQSLTVVYSLLISLLVALFLIPMLSALLARGTGLREHERITNPVGRGIEKAGGWLLAGAALLFGAVGKLLELLVWPFQPLYQAVERVYPPLVRGALRLRAVVVLAAVALLVLAGLQIPRLGDELLPDVAQGEFYVETFLPRDATVERTDAVVAPLERAISERPEVAQTFLAVGVDDEELNSSEEGEHSARILIRLRPGDDPAAAEEELRTAIRERIRRIPEIESFRFARPSVLSFGAPLVVELVGKDLYALRRASADVEAALREVPGLRDVRSTMQRGNPELVLRLDRDKMSALGIDSGVVTDILDAKVLGEVPTRFAERDRKVDMRVALAREELDRVARLLDINVNPAGDPPIPLAAVAEVRRLEGPSEIRRIGNTRGAEVHADVKGFDLGTTQELVLDAVAQVDLPSGVEARLGGQKSEMDRSMDSVVTALLLAVFLVYVVMASQFESLVQPFVILLSLPLAFVGVIGVLLATGTPVSVLVLLGCIVLAGIVVNNAIIMIDQINRLRAEGLDKRRAIVEGARSRLRPVLMTTTTTVLGLLPLTGWLPLGGNQGVELRAPLAITVVAGLVASTLLTLLVIPVAYSLSDRRA